MSVQDVNPWGDFMDWLKTAGDYTSVAITVGTIADYLPPIAAALAIVYWCVRLYETDTVQTWVFRRRLRKQQETEHDEVE